MNRQWPRQEMTARWAVARPDESRVAELVSACGLSATVARLLVNRGLNTPESVRRFFEVKLADLHDPFLLNDMERAVGRVLSAVQRGEPIHIYGDYDVDGIAGVTLLRGALQKVGASIQAYLPNRIVEGYGLSREGIERCHRKGCRLLLTVDCGVTSNEPIAHARSLGMDVIVTDHHEPESDLPECVAVLDPKRADSTYPFRDLAGVGVAFKFAHALLRCAAQQGIVSQDEAALRDFLDLVALGTVADGVPLLGENRIFTRHGLRSLACSRRQGLQQLMALSNVGEAPTSSDVAFKLAPRLNATGRLGDAQRALDLLLSEDEREAFHLATIVEENNRRRQRLEGELLDEVERRLESRDDLHAQKAVVLSSTRWHPGIIPVVASRLASRLYRPVVVIAIEEDFGRGSARSVPGFDMVGALRRCADLLDRFGGHRGAAGFRIRREHIAAFEERFLAVAGEMLEGAALVPTTYIDAEVTLDEVDLEFARRLADMEPFGQGNPAPVLIARNAGLRGTPKVVGGDHLKLWFEARGGTVEAIGFSMGWMLERLAGTQPRYDIVFVPEISAYGGSQAVQLLLKDLRPATP